MKFCQAMVRVGSPGRTTWARCGVSPTEVHHRLTRARGGLILDALGETYHLLDLCRKHHNTAHDTGTALKTGLLLDGYVITTHDGVIYYGSDEYLSRKYPRRGPVSLWVLRGPEASEDAGAAL